MSTGARPKSVKKKVHNVPSRYLQVPEKVSVGENSSLKTSKEMSRSSSSQDISGISKLSTSSTSSQGLTSTPAFKVAFPLPPLDESAVSGIQSQLSFPVVKERIVPKSPNFVKKNIRKQKMANVTMMHRPVIASHKEKSFNEKIANAEMDLLYAQYLQSLFLVSESKKSLEKRSSSAADTLHKLLALVQKHLDTAKSQKVLLTVITTLIEAHEHCQKQHEILKPVFESIPALEEKYKSLAKAISATKHKLYIKDVILSDSNEIQENLQKMSEFLTLFFEAVPNLKDVNSASDVFEKYVDFAEHLTQELKRGVDLLTKAQELYISEASLALGCKNL